MMLKGTVRPGVSVDISGNAQVPVLQLLCNTLECYCIYILNLIMGCKATFNCCYHYPSQSNYEKMNC